MPVTYTLQGAWREFQRERAAVLCATSLTADYRQVTKWIDRCPVTDFEQGRQAMSWVLTQKPIKSARRVAAYMKSLYRWASAEDVAIITRNPVANFRMPKPPQSDDEVIVIPRQETALLFTALQARQRKNPWAEYSEWMLQTAMRTGEVRAMRWDDIEDDRVLVHANYTLTHGLKNSTKTNKRRTVPLNQRCQELLGEVPRVDEYVFPVNRMAYMSFFYERAVELHSAGLATHRYRPYDLRHTAISRWIEAGIPVAQAAKWAGNSSEVIWKHYCNVTQEYEMPIL